MKSHKQVLGKDLNHHGNQSLPNGLFISFEGGEGVGKSTQIERLASYLRQSGQEVMTTREPGGTFGAEALRTLIKQQASAEWDAITETLLIYAARRDHVEKIIKPALAKGMIVLCDRFHDSTLAYQGGGRGVDAEWIMKLHLHILGDFIPEITFLLMMPPDQGLKRASLRLDDELGKLDVFEAAGLAFHQRVYKYFGQLAELSPKRIIKINADMAIDQIEAKIQHHLSLKLSEIS